jgi:hypothetical protein
MPRWLYSVLRELSQTFLLNQFLDIYKKQLSHTRYVAFLISSARRDSIFMIDRAACTLPLVILTDSLIS